MLSIRLLHVTIVAATLLLFVRLGDVWVGFQGSNVALAQEAGEEEEAAQEGGADGDGAVDELEEEDDLLAEEFTFEEVQVLQDLVDRRDALEARERELNLRESLLNVAEQRIETKITNMEDLRTEIQGLLRQYDEQEEAELKSLVKIYETMKAKDAARILQELEPRILLSIMALMKERSSASVLAAMDAPTARIVTTQLARRQVIDQPGG